MAKKKQKNSSQLNIKGGVHAGRDVIMGDQVNYGPRDIDVTNVTTPGEFTAKLAEVQTAIAALKQQPGLNAAQTRNIESAEKKVAKAAAEVEKEALDKDAIKETLTEAKETFDLLSGSLTSAAGLGVVLGNLIALVMKIFGG